LGSYGQFGDYEVVDYNEAIAGLLDSKLVDPYFELYTFDFGYSLIKFLLFKLLIFKLLII